MTYALRALLIPLIFFALSLGGCGNKGPLFLPDPTADEEQQQQDK